MGKELIINAEDLDKLFQLTEQEKASNLEAIKEVLLRDFSPVTKMSDTDEFYSTEEIMEGLTSIIPGIEIMQVRKALTDCGFKYTNIGEFCYKWMLKTKTSESFS
jgi:hypothetical protein